MDIHAFKATLAAPEAPADLSPELKALWQDAREDWGGAHGTVQECRSAEGAWVHAYLHRKEGDLANAGYWYDRAGREPSQASLAEEWEAIAIALL